MIIDMIIFKFKKEVAKQLVESFALDISKYINQFNLYQDTVYSWNRYARYAFGNTVYSNIVDDFNYRTHFNLYLNDPTVSEDDRLLYHCHYKDLLYVILHYNDELKKIEESIDQYFDKHYRTSNLEER